MSRKARLIGAGSAAALAAVLTFGGTALADDGTGTGGTRVTGEDPGNKEYGTDGTRVTGADEKEW